MTKLPSIPLLRPSLPNAQALLPYLQQIDANAFYTNFGPLNESFLERITSWQRERFSRPVHAVTTSSATLALELLITDLRLPVGSRILIPALTFVATATAVLRCGHVPVVADISATHWMMTPETLARDLDTSTVQAVIPVAAFGMPQPIEAWSQWQKNTGIPVIIDAAAAIGAQSTAANVPVVFSLHATKCLSTGEGGLVLTENAPQAQRIAQLSNFGIGSHGLSGGTNAKLSEYHAAVGHAGLDAWETHCRLRLKLHSQYCSLLEHTLGTTMTFQKNTGLVAPTSMVTLLANSATRERVEHACQKQGIQTRRWYQPLIHEQSGLLGVQAPFEIPNAIDIASRLLGLPFFMHMTEPEMQRVSRVLFNAVHQ
jgi:dTDP-4-amino-4,6-dideoxygalactose transaminase